MIETKNAKIEGTHLGWEDHGIFTFILKLDYGGSGQCAGSYALDEWFGSKGSTGERGGTAMGLDLVMAVLKTVGVQKWEDLPGLHIRVRADNSKVHAIGNYLEDKWLDFAAFFEKRPGTAGKVEGTHAK